SHGPQLRAPVKAVLGGLAEADAHFGRRHLVQGFVVLVVHAAQPGEGGVADQHADRRADATLDAVDRDPAEALGAVCRQARTGLDRTGDAPRDVVVDARVEHGQAVFERSVAPLDPEFDAGRALRLELRIADVVVAVAARRVLEALTHVGRAIAAAEVGVDARPVRQRADRAHRPGQGRVLVIEAGGLRGGARALACGVAGDPVESCAGHYARAAEIDLVLHEYAGGTQHAIVERIV